MAAVDAWKHSNVLCKNYILNGLDNALYNVYSPVLNAKALWGSLEKKYKTEDTGSKKFVVGKFLDFKTVDSKTVMNQVQVFQLILHDIDAKGMVLGESFQVAALIEKLPPTWKDFKKYLKHKRKEIKPEDLIVRLRIEEDDRQSEAKANVVEQDRSTEIGHQPHSPFHRLPPAIDFFPSTTEQPLPSSKQTDRQSHSTLHSPPELIEQLNLLRQMVERKAAAHEKLQY
ncbi:hypothetical protein RJ639_044685 [Escallonia herrerae]|uniref:Uncharacterized protein n=1 Tax=Escallonia herrerae TaxID=1293975 RepID=A0AA88WAU6_9ASTE|nr:hypothetical protein RJ639_044685 [Escallonia herrerae]